MDHRVHGGQTAGHGVGVRGDTRKEGGDLLQYAFRLCGRQHPQAQTRDDAPDGGGVGGGFSADVRGGVHLGEGDTAGSGLAEDARPFEDAEGAGHEDNGLPDPEVRGADFGEGLMGVGRHDEEGEVGGV